MQCFFHSNYWIPGLGPYRAYRSPLETAAAPAAGCCSTAASAAAAAAGGGGGGGGMSWLW